MLPHGILPLVTLSPRLLLGCCCGGKLVSALLLLRRVRECRSEVGVHVVKSPRTCAGPGLIVVAVAAAIVASCGGRVVASGISVGRGVGGGRVIVIIVLLHNRHGGGGGLNHAILIARCIGFNHWLRLGRRLRLRCRLRLRRWLRLSNWLRLWLRLRLRRVSSCGLHLGLEWPARRVRRLRFLRNEGHLPLTQLLGDAATGVLRHITADVHGTTKRRECQPRGQRAAYTAFRRLGSRLCASCRAVLLYPRTRLLVATVLASGRLGREAAVQRATGGALA